MAWGPAQRDQGEARRNGVYNADLLEQAMLDPRTGVIALDDYDLGLVGLARQEDPSVLRSKEWPFKLFPALVGRFKVVRTVPSFGQFAGTLYIMRRIDDR